MDGSPISDALVVLQGAVTDFLKAAGHGEFGVLSNAEFLYAVRDVEAVRRQLATADYPIVAEQLGERRALTGEVPAALRPAAAEARSLGILSGEQTRVI